MRDAAIAAVAASAASVLVARAPPPPPPPPPVPPPRTGHPAANAPPRAMSKRERFRPDPIVIDHSHIRDFGGGGDGRFVPPSSAPLSTQRNFTPPHQQHLHHHHQHHPHHHRQGSGRKFTPPSAPGHNGGKFVLPQNHSSSPRLYNLPSSSRATSLPTTMSATLPPLVEQAMSRRTTTFSPDSTTTTTTTSKGQKPWTQRWQQPCGVVTCSLALVLGLTSGVLYWNYTETLGEKGPKGVILDHWGKGSPSDVETIKLKRQLNNFERRMEAEGGVLHIESAEGEDLLPASVDASDEGWVTAVVASASSDDIGRGRGKRRRRPPDGFFRSAGETAKGIPGAEGEGGDGRGIKWSRRKKRRKKKRGRRNRGEVGQESGGGGTQPDMKANE